MKIENSILGLIMIMYGCTPFHYSQKDIIGTYTQIREDSVKSDIDLKFDNLHFTLVDVADYSERHHGGGKYQCCDTVAYGTWSIDNKHGVLALSTPQLSNGHVKPDIQEEINSSSDSLFFFISNPIEKDMGRNHHNIFYLIDVNSLNTSFVEDLTGVEFNTNRIVVPNPNHAKIIDFVIEAYTKPEYYARNIAIDPVKTKIYKVKTYNSNVFRINIPDLTYEYITYLRLHDHLLKIASKNELIWDGIRYMKKY